MLAFFVHLNFSAQPFFIGRALAASIQCILYILQHHNEK